MLWTLARTLPRLITIRAGYTVESSIFFIYETASNEVFFSLVQGHDRVLLVVFFLVDASVPFLAQPPKFLSLHVLCWIHLILFLNDDSFTQCWNQVSPDRSPYCLEQFLNPGARICIQCRRKPPNVAGSQLSFPNGTMPPTAPKSRPISSAHCKRSTKLENKQNYHPKSAKHHGNARRPNGFKLWVVQTKWCVSI